jgi:tetratricopeptide (TPR) repeat protein
MLKGALYTLTRSLDLMLSAWANNTGLIILMTSHDNPLRAFQRQNYFWLALVLALTSVTYIYTLSFGFVGDDNVFLVNNPGLISAAITDFFSNGVWSFSNTEFTGSQLYRPLALINYRIQFGLWGANPAGYHAVSILSHLLVVVMVFKLLVRLSPQSPPYVTAFATALFAVHPVQVESVAWILGGTDVWASFWLFSGVLSYYYFKDQKKWLGIGFLGLFGLMSMLSKEVAFTAPILMTIILLADEENYFWRDYVKPVGVLLISLSIVLVMRNYVVDSADLRFDYKGFLRLVDYLLGYAKALVFPWPQKFYTTEPWGIFAAWEALVGGVLLVGSGVALIRFRFKLNHFFLGLTWWAIVLLPAFALAFHQVRPTFAYRLMYLSIFGLALIVQWGLTRLQGTRRAVGLAVVGIVVLLYAGGSAKMAESWRNEESLINMSIASNPESYGLWTSKGNLMRDQNRMDEATTAFQNALIRAKNQSEVSGVQDLLGEVYAQAGLYDKSEEMFNRVVSLDPGDSHAWNGLGNIAWLKKDYSLAISMYERALVEAPDNTEARKNLKQVKIIADQAGNR